MQRRRPVSRKGLVQASTWSFFGTLACLAVSTAYNYVVFAPHGGEILWKALATATVLPIVLAGPLFFYLTLKLRELAAANHKLSVIASTDALTDCLNRGAFTAGVETWLERADARRSSDGGALLVIDADHFKSINDRFGHQRGDEALRLLAATMRANVRSTDHVGRLGGEEFGIFLPGADASVATVVAERLRRGISEIDFAPDGKPWRLSASIGVVVFTGSMRFAELFRLADERLYKAKEMGRDRVEIRRLVPTVPIDASSMIIH